MSDEKDLVVEELNKILEEHGLFKVLSIDNINHEPHKFMIGPPHIKHAAEKHGGMLGETTLRAVKCVYPGCTTSYDDHKSTKVVFLQLKRDGKNDEANGELILIKQILTDNAIEGIVMVESDPEYRIT